MSVVERRGRAAAPPLGLLKERDEVASRDELVHRLVGRPRRETARSIEHPGQQRHVADGIQEDARPAEHPVHRQVDVFLFAERLVPRRRGLFAAADFARLAERLARLKARFILTIGDTPEIRKLFKGFAIETADVTYTTGSKPERNRARELIITSR